MALRLEFSKHWDVGVGGIRVYFGLRGRIAALPTGDPAHWLEAVAPFFLRRKS